MDQPDLFDGEYAGLDADGRQATNGARIVYFYDCGNGRIKIGFTGTGSPESRGRAGRTWIPELKLIGSIVVGAEQTDTFLHERFGIYRIGNSELFRDTPELRRAIAELINPNCLAVCFSPHIEGRTWWALDCPLCGAWFAWPANEGVRLYSCSTCCARITITVSFDPALEADRYRQIPGPPAARW